MTSKRQLDFEGALADMFDNELELRLILDGLEEIDVEQVPASRQKSSLPGAKLADGDRINIQQLIDRDEQNFKQELDIEGGRGYRNMKMYSQPRFRLLGYSQEGKPLFKISDLFMVTDPRLKSIVDKYINEIVHGSAKNVVLETGDLSKKYEKGYDFAKLIENWEKKEYEDFTSNKKNMLDEKQLEEIVVNRGDSKDNYWIYKVGEKKKFDYQDIFSQRTRPSDSEYFNQNLLNPRFIENMHKAADRMRMQYAQIQQFQSQDECEQPKNSERAEKQGQNNNEEQQGVNYWGEIPRKSIKGLAEKSKVMNPVKAVLIEQQIRDIATVQKKQGNKKIKIDIDETQNKNSTFVDQIIKQFSVINHEIVNNKYRGKQTLNEYNRIEFHLENPNFFLTKLHYALQKRSEQFSNFLQGNNDSNGEPGLLNRNISAQSAFGLDRSIVSGSRTANQQQTLRPSQMENNVSLNAQDDDHETIEAKIAREMGSQPKRTIMHSDVATKLNFIKFSNQLNDFKNFHRHEFKYDHYLSKKIKIRLLRHPKPLKTKGTDLNINIEKKDSHTKFSRADTISLASEQIKQFILIEYIQENPLLMSDVGMCERMMLQVNNKEMLQKIQKDAIENMEIDAVEEFRDNPGENKGSQNMTTEQKMELWRRNIKNYFGENGKVYLWEPKRQSKLIGNPDGLGVALMESKLAAMPIVKKTPNKRDFLLVRDGNKWVLRKIDSVYVSGQVQPKQLVFSPGDRAYQTFLEKYQVDFLTKVALTTPNYRITIEHIKNFFPNTPQTSAQSRIRKILKQKMNAETKDNKTYQIKIGEDEEVNFKLSPQQYCIYQRMQKSLCELEEVGIRNMKNMEKMKSILRKYFRKSKTKDLEHFATARMIRDQLQLTSWYLTESFRKFIQKNARIEMSGHADPTNGHGGYSFIKKPQKERTDKDQAQQRQERSKLSGTQFDLRKLKGVESVALLQRFGLSRQLLETKGRWQLVALLKSQKDTEYSRKERESKQLKQQNERKQRSKALNTLLKYLKNEQQGLIEAFDYSFEPYLTLDYYCKREMANWQTAKQKLEQTLRTGEQGDENEEDGDEDD